MRIVQPGTGDRRNVLVTFFCGVRVAQFAKDLGPSPMVISVDERRAPVSRSMLRDLVVAKGGEELGEIALAGYSAGGHGVRDVLDEVRPECVFVFDGTHGSIPQPGSMPLEPWRELADRARREAVLFVASHTYLVYTEKLRPPQGPYLSTVSVLREITGWPLEEPESEHPSVRRQGGLVVYSYRSGDADAPAHARQIQDVAPMIVRDWLGSRWGSTEMASGETVHGLIKAAAATLQPEPLDPELVRTLPHGYRCSVAELVADARALGTWRPKGSSYIPKIGDLVITGRQGEDPTTGGRGHVERIVTTFEQPLDPRIAETLGGNEGNTWKVEKMDLEGANVLGYIDVPAELGKAACREALTEYHAGVKETAGTGSTERIQEYHAGARRGGSRLAGMPGHETEGSAVLGAHASDEIPWCASSASWCMYQAAKS